MVSSTLPAERCRSCGAEREAAALDAQGWCGDCRAVVVRRATWVARAAGLAAALLVATLVAVLVAPTRFLIFWLALIVGSYVFVVKLVRRMAFEVIHARGLGRRRRG